MRHPGYGARDPHGFSWPTVAGAPGSEDGSWPVVLVVDDNDDVRLLLRHVLSHAGFRVVEAGTGAAALALLRRGERAQVAVLDVHMPDMDGWETLAALRAEPGTAELPVVLCTVKSGVTDLERAWELGCDGYLVKPFDIAELSEVVSSVVLRSPEERAAFRKAKLEEARGASGEEPPA
jgi:two-component system copper resistance phosphate regulon response regulator CusR